MDFDFGWNIKSGDKGEKEKRPPLIKDPDRILETNFNCIDTAAWYAILFRPKTMAAIDLDDVRAVTLAINGGNGTSTWEENANLPARKSFTKRIKKVLQ
ncbi:hypothetical protein C798_01400 [Herbaspirillum rubrisubalbicans Os34]|uniref:Uncharacterized protein n=1 Tax=Herbaspirillum rubrisubalbicans Os34 TaxID=1235827 RepID=A0A6M3ZK38_9BURK|nr:hypothetical protein [Herbaspirillum rubrisubalbicans]QJP98930.1 hypothetical protein C798_01400 [Herbaspirillum rubrisubalbicans Os34]